MAAGRTSLFVVLAALWWALPATALERSVEAGLFSGYVDRGVVYNDRPVFQPSAFFTTDFGFSAGIWGNIDLTQRNRMRNEFNQIEPELSYALPLPGPIGVVIGYSETHFPHQDLDPEREVFLSLETDAEVSTTFAVYANAEDLSSVYAAWGLIYRRNLMPNALLDLGLSTGFSTPAYNEDVYQLHSAAFNDVSFTADLDWPWTDHLSLTVTLQYSFLPDASLRRAARSQYLRDRVMIVGVTVRSIF